MPRRGLRTSRHSRLTSTWPATVAEQARLTGAHLREAWGSFLGRIPWQWFATLTFDPTRSRPASRAVVEREATWWARLVAKMARWPVGWVCAPERGRGGLWHGHLLLLGPSQDWSPAAACPVWQARNGRIDLRPVQHAPGIALYTSKEAATAGTIILSETLTRYQPRASTTIVVPLWTEDTHD